MHNGLSEIKLCKGEYDALNANTEVSDEEKFEMVWVFEGDVHVEVSGDKYVDGDNCN